MVRFDPDGEPGYAIGEVDPAIVRLLRLAAEEYDRGDDPSESGRYFVVLMPPDVAEYYRFGRTEPGLRIFDGSEWIGDAPDLAAAGRAIAADTGHPVDLVEHHEGGLWYWTAIARMMQQV